MTDHSKPDQTLSSEMTPHPLAPAPGALSRRGFIGAALGGGALAGLPASAQTTAVPPLDEVERLFFSEGEWSRINALCDALIPAEGDGPGALETRVPVFIDRQLAGEFGKAASWYMEGPFDPGADPNLGFQSPFTPARIYREGIAWFDEWCERTEAAGFLDLDREARGRVVAALMDKSVDFPPELRDFPDFLLKNTKEGYLADPRHGGNEGMEAWSYIGFPGARGSFLPWTSSEKDDDDYPLGPVAISGERA